MRKLLVIMIVVIALTAALNAQSLKIKKTDYQPGEKIQVHFKAPASFPGNAWVGIVPSHVPHGKESVNDQHDLAYQYLSKKTEGTLIFTAPTKPGMYDFRMNDSDGSGKEVAAIQFSVGGVFLRLDKVFFKPGEKIALTYSAPDGLAGNAWIGIVPSHVEHGKESVNDQHDLTYQYLNKKKSGVLTYTAPTKPGRYDFRMNDTDSNGKEIASITFKVK